MNGFFSTIILFYLMILNIFVFVLVHVSNQDIYETYLFIAFNCDWFLRCSKSVFKNQQSFFVGTT